MRSTFARMIFVALLLSPASCLACGLWGWGEVTHVEQQGDRLEITAICHWSQQEMKLALQDGTLTFRGSPGPLDAVVDYSREPFSPAEIRPGQELLVGLMSDPEQPVYRLTILRTQADQAAWRKSYNAAISQASETEPPD